MIEIIKNTENLKEDIEIQEDLVYELKHELNDKIMTVIGEDEDEEYYANFGDDGLAKTLIEKYVS